MNQARKDYLKASSAFFSFMNIKDKGIHHLLPASREQEIRLNLRRAYADYKAAA